MECPVQPPLVNIESERATKIIWRNTIWSFKDTEEQINSNEMVSKDPILQVSQSAQENTPHPLTVTSAASQMTDENQGIRQSILTGKPSTSTDEREMIKNQQIHSTDTSSEDHAVPTILDDTTLNIPLSSTQETEVAQRETMTEETSIIMTQIPMSTEDSTNIENLRRRRSSGTININ